jgi:alpha(1,3/1,4) fucosyltransferase
MRFKTSISVKKLLSLSLFICATLHGEKIVQCVTDFPIEAEDYTQALKERGYDGKVVVVDADHVKKDADKIVFFNIRSKTAKKLSGIPKSKLILFMWEPETVLRRMYSKKVRARFSKVFTWNDALVDGKTHFKMFYPSKQDFIANIPPFHEKKLCTLVASDLSSHHKNELYSERKASIRFFEQAGEAGFEFYGRKWDPALFKSYRGAPEDKIGTIKHYRFCICYENMKDTPGYITEKIFDCFAAGVIPVYWGASNVQDYIPPECFIDRRKFASMEKLYTFMKAMTEEEHAGYIDRIKAYLVSEKSQLFSQEHFLEIFCDAMIKP